MLFLQQRECEALEHIWQSAEGSTRLQEQRYIDTLIAFDEVHSLGVFNDYKGPRGKGVSFDQYFDKFRRHAEVSAKKIKMEAARRLKAGEQTIVVLDAPAREAIHALIGAIREKLNELALSENKREALFNKLNAFASEVDRNRTRTEAFLAFVVDLGRTAGAVKKELEPIRQPVDRILDLIEKAVNSNDALPLWKDRKRIEGPPKRIAPPQQDVDDDIPS